ncbi:hypothetical protein BTA51_13935 [Hahella sp. CCB-MM4]|uniref:tetratricopeptide repeat protein n=1 Tax=Hahella sp. (strain CCB-MM4) TaxID=1926491 RepID=UPI000B9A2DAF|nr:tetratricopeptide repeat protein [Hahella sp. CCB-MM4]OZG72625.1 hypothetical protein BTA51_13935 [Hahella sp. CCB-MM4]
MQLIKLSRVLMSVLLVATVSGCAHHNLMEAGEDYTSQGRYELAMQAYQKALKLEPDDQETMDQFSQSRDRFNQWLTSVRQAADKSYAQDHRGKAMLLYGKIADATQDPTALTRYNEIHQEMADNHQLYIQLEKDPILFGNYLGEEINGLTLVHGSISHTPETSSVYIQRGPVRFHYQETESPEVGQYVSGQVPVDNPEYASLQQEASMHRHRVEHERNQLMTYRQDQKDLGRERRSLEKDLRVVENKLSKLDPATSEYQQKKLEQEDLRSKISGLNDRIRWTKDKIHEQRRDVDHAERELEDILTGFDRIPPTIWEDVISDYHYTRYILSKTAESTLIVDIDGRRREVPLEVVSEDDHYPDHPTISLAGKSANLESDQAMTQRLNNEARTTAENQLKSMVYQHKQGLLALANQANDSEERLTGWVAHGIAGNPGVENDVASKMRAHLELEFGKAGEFDINHLLTLYPTF